MSTSTYQNSLEKNRILANPSDEEIMRHYLQLHDFDGEDSNIYTLAYVSYSGPILHDGNQYPESSWIFYNKNLDTIFHQWQESAIEDDIPTCITQNRGDFGKDFIRVIHDMRSLQNERCHQLQAQDS